MHSAGLELTKLTYTRLEDNLIRHRGDWHIYVIKWGSVVYLSDVWTVYRIEKYATNSTVEVPHIPSEGCGYSRTPINLTPKAYFVYKLKAHPNGLGIPRKIM